jgi:GTPase
VPTNDEKKTNEEGEDGKGLSPEEEAKEKKEFEG